MKTSAKMRILLSSLFILALCAYAGCNSGITRWEMPHASQQSVQKNQGTVQKSNTKQAQDLTMKTVGINTPDGEVTFNAQVAETASEREVGLMYRKEMPMSEGMFFLFDEEQPLTFWMKNTLIPLDIIFIDQDWRIVSIQKNAKPCKADPCILYPSSGNAQYVLEINGGLSDKLGIEEGEDIQLN